MYQLKPHLHVVHSIQSARKDHLLDLIGHFFPAGPAPTVADLAECHQTAQSLVKLPWVQFLATVEMPNGFARALSLVAPIELTVADAVYAYCRSH